MKKICIASLRCLAVLLTVIMVMAATMLPAKAYITYSCGHNSGQHSDPLHVRLIGYEIEEQTSSGHYKRPIFATLCPVCGAEIGTERGIGTDYEKHSFDTNGCCKVCGYVTSTNECDHNFNHWGSEFLGWGTPDKENHYRKFELWYRCYWCNELAYTEEVIEPERHKFDANGRCTVCGYTSSSSGSCKHTNKKSEKVGSVSKQYDDKYHETIVTYRDVCADCNAVLSAERKDTNKFDHRFDANGTCFCGYVQAKRPCDHTPTETLKDTKYGKADINGHEVIKTYHYECECKQVSYDEKKTSVGAHDYNRNTCRLCGFEKECEHPDFENVVSTAVEKNPNSASMHIIVTTYAEKCFCGAANPNPVKRTAEACRFIKNTDVQSVHEKQGHQYVDKCECGNEKANGKFKAYVSGCADCKHFYDQCVLSRGNASNIPEKVKELQELLMRSGYDLPYYGADGDFSRETEKAVEKFQKDHGLPVTGVVDEATWNALKNTLNYTDTLSKGNPSNKTHVVKELQELLIKNGYELPYYGADGDFSRETEKAVKKFQKDHGLPETGVVDEATWAMLRNPDGTFETDAPGHGPMEGLTDDNPSHSSAETLPPKADSDDDTEGTPSHAPMEGIDEGEPDHGTMEGIEDDSPSHSLDATLPPKIEDESEVVIDGSFGKASYTAEIGDTLSISVRAGSENANLERVTINVDGSGVDRLASEAISGTAWSGTLPLNCSAYPLNTPGTYTLKLYVSADAGDPNWAIVDYATLVVNDAPVKPDKPVVNVAIDGNTMTATWNAVDGADRYVYSLYNITDDYRIVQHASANKLAASASLEAGKQYRIAVAAVPASVRDTMTETDMCSWTEVVFEMPIAEEADDMIPAVLSVTTNARSRTLLPGDPFTAAVVCNKYTSSLRVSGVENGYISNTYVDEEGRSCFAYTGSFTHNGVYQIRFTAVDPMGVYVENQTYSVVVPVTVCDHTVGEPVLVSEGKAEYANNDQHLIVCTYEKACVCREVVESYPENVLKAHVLSKSCAYDLEHKDGLGHGKYYVCSVCNGDSFSGGDHPGKDDYSEYEEDLGKSGRCAVCQDKYNEKQRIMEAQSLLQGLGYNIGAAGADGVLGTDTLAALNAFRADVMGLGAIGNVDEDTLRILRNHMEKKQKEQCSMYGEHQYSIIFDEHISGQIIVNPNGAYHNVLYRCDCGSMISDSIVMDGCCLCVGHDWSVYEEGICTICGEDSNQQKLDLLKTSKNTKEIANIIFASDNNIRDTIVELVDKQGDSISQNTSDEVIDELTSFNLGKAISQTLANPFEAGAQLGDSNEDDGEEMLKTIIKAMLSEGIVFDSLDSGFTVSDLGLFTTQAGHVIEKELLQKLGTADLDEFDKVLDATKDSIQVREFMGTYGWESISFAVTCFDVNSMTKSEKEQLIQMVNNISESQRYLNSIISSTDNYPLKNACEEILAEIEEAERKCYDAVERDGWIDIGEAAGNTGINILFGLSPVGSVTGWVNFATKGENATYNTADDLIIYTYVRSLASMELKHALANEEASAYDLFQLYKEIELVGYDITEEYYDNFLKSWKGHAAHMWGLGSYDPEAMLTWIKSDRAMFIDQCSEIDFKWLDFYVDALRD